MLNDILHNLFVLSCLLLLLLVRLDRVLHIQLSLRLLLLNGVLHHLFIQSCLLLLLLLIRLHRVLHIELSLRLLLLNRVLRRLLLLLIRTLHILSGLRGLLRWRRRVRWALRW